MERDSIPRMHEPLTDFATRAAVAVTVLDATERRRHAAEQCVEVVERLHRAMRQLVRHPPPPSLRSRAVDADGDGKVDDGEAAASAATTMVLQADDGGAGSTRIAQLVRSLDRVRQESALARDQLQDTTLKIGQLRRLLTAKQHAVAAESNVLRPEVEASIRAVQRLAEQTSTWKLKKQEYPPPQATVATVARQSPSAPALPVQHGRQLSGNQPHPHLHAATAGTAMGGQSPSTPRTAEHSVPQSARSIASPLMTAATAAAASSSLLEEGGGGFTGSTPSTGATGDVAQLRAAERQLAEQQREFRRVKREWLATRRVEAAATMLERRLASPVGLAPDSEEAVARMSQLRDQLHELETLRRHVQSLREQQLGLFKRQWASLVAQPTVTLGMLGSSVTAALLAGGNHRDTLNASEGRVGKGGIASGGTGTGSTGRVIGPASMEAIRRLNEAMALLKSTVIHFREDVPKIKSLLKLTTLEREQQFKASHNEVKISIGQTMTSEELKQFQRHGCDRWPVSHEALEDRLPSHRIDRTYVALQEMVIAWDGLGDESKARLTTAKDVVANADLLLDFATIVRRLRDAKWRALTVRTYALTGAVAAGMSNGGGVSQRTASAAAASQLGGSPPRQP